MIRRHKEVSRIRRQRWIAVAVLVFAATSSSGCFWIAVDGAGALGYEVGKDDRLIGVKFDGASITTGVKTQFINDEKIDALDINVNTDEGIVSLNGSVPSKCVESRAIQIARGVKGVRSKFVMVSP